MGGHLCHKGIWWFMVIVGSTRTPRAFLGSAPACSSAWDYSCPGPVLAIPWLDIMRILSHFSSLTRSLWMAAQLWCISHSSQFHIICKCADTAAQSTRFINSEVKQFWPQYQPLGHQQWLSSGWTWLCFQAVFSPLHCPLAEGSMNNIHHSLLDHCAHQFCRRVPKPS